MNKKEKDRSFVLSYLIYLGHNRFIFSNRVLKQRLSVVFYTVKTKGFCWRTWHGIHSSFRRILFGKFMYMCFVSVKTIQIFYLTRISLNKSTFINHFIPSNKRELNLERPNMFLCFILSCSINFHHAFETLLLFSITTYFLVFYSAECKTILQIGGIPSD